MKKLQFFFLFLLSFLFLQKINGQWSVTPSLGVNNAKIINNDKSPKHPLDLDANSANYIMGGVTAKYNFTKKYAAELGVQFSQKGQQVGNDDFGFRYKVQYYELMPVFEYSPFSFLSFYSGLNIGVKGDEFFSSDNKNWQQLPKTGSWLHPIDFGGLIGARLKYRKIQLGIHANRSIIPISKYMQTNDNGEYIGDIKEFHRVFQLSLGYIIDFKDN